MKNLLITIVILTCFCLANCEKDTQSNNLNNIPGLPPATQMGANTFGFLLNGVPWTPKGNNGTANLSIDFDPGFNNGILNISAYSTLNLNTSRIVIFIKDSLNSIPTIPTSYKIGSSFLGGLGFTDTELCQRRSEQSTNFCTGSIMITKLDRLRNIVAGVFDCTIFNPACGDTIKITNGRFDFKF